MYSHSRKTENSFDEEESALRVALKEEGFGIITEIDVQRTVKEKLGLDMRRYKILGACNPQFAHRAIEAEPDIGILLPCNVLIRESETGQTVISCILPSVQLGKTGNAMLTPIAEEVETRLKRAIDKAAS